MWVVPLVYFYFNYRVDGQIPPTDRYSLNFRCTYCVLFQRRNTLNKQRENTRHSTKPLLSHPFIYPFYRYSSPFLPPTPFSPIPTYIYLLSYLTIMSISKLNKTLCWLFNDASSIMVAWWYEDECGAVSVIRIRGVGDRSTRRKPAQCDSVHHNTHMTWPWIEPGLLLWEAGDLSYAMASKLYSVDVRMNNQWLITKDSEGNCRGLIIQIFAWGEMPRRT